MLYDAIIVGGGPAGCATALSLCRSNPNASFLLLDDADPKSFKVGESLPAGATRILRYLSETLYARVSQDTSLGKHTQCTGNASAWSSEEIEEEYSIMNPYGMGWHLDRSLFDESLREAVKVLCETGKSRSTPSMVERVRFVSAEKCEDGWRVYGNELGSHERKTYCSKWIVDATGRKASLAHKLGAATIKTDSLLAFYALFDSYGEDSDHRTFIEAAESGWWYTSQLAGNRRIVVYHTDDVNLSAKMARTQEGFLNLLLNHTIHVSRTILECDYTILPGERYPRCTAAGSSFLQPVCDEADQWCAVGDAAIAFDPLSSQGMRTALDSGCFVGAELAKRVVVSLEESRTGELRDISNHFVQVREKYEREKQYYYSLVEQFGSDFWEQRQT